MSIESSDLPTPKKPTMRADLLEAAYEKWLQHQRGDNPYDIYDEVTEDVGNSSSTKVTALADLATKNVVEEIINTEVGDISVDQFGLPIAVVNEDGDVGVPDGIMRGREPRDEDESTEVYLNGPYPTDLPHAS